MLRFLATVLLVATAAVHAAEITHLDPVQGFTFGTTTIEIQGTDLVPNGVTCSANQCGGTDSCPVAVYYGDERALLLDASPTLIRARVFLHAEGAVPIIVRVEGRPDLVAPVPFTFSEQAIASRADYEGYLLPVTTTPRGGQGGSQWETTWTVQNGSQYLPLRIVSTEVSDVPRGATRELQATRRDGRDGAFIWLPNALNPDTGMSLRVRDVSRGAANRGTDVPIVPVESFAQTIRILDVPTDARHRSTLRLYAEAPAVARVRVFGSSQTPMLDQEVSLSRGPLIVEGSFVREPAYAMLEPVTAAMRDVAAEVRIEITSEARVWGMVSVTNNATQQVTLVTPQPVIRPDAGASYSAAPVAVAADETIRPARGAPFGETYVSINSAEIEGPYAGCGYPCSGACPATVKFGTESGRVTFLQEGRLDVWAPPQRSGLTVDVTVTARGRTFRIPNGFTYDRHAVDGVPYSEMLMPLVPRKLAGANGSQWETRLSVQNASEHVLVMKLGSNTEFVEPKSVKTFETFPGAVHKLEGAKISVPYALRDQVAMQLRVRDVSQSDRDWGTEIPIVDTYQAAVRLVDVPTDSRYRATLRVYSNGSSTTSAAVRVEALDGTLLDQLAVRLNNDGDLGTPAYGMIDPITETVRASGHDRVNVVVIGPIIFDPPPSPVWAFISLTNNETQQVTTITPRGGRMF